MATLSPTLLAPTLLPTFAMGAHALAAAVFALVAAWQASRWREPAARTLVAACLATAGWGWASVAFAPHAVLPQVAEGVRNLGWLGFVMVLGKHAARQPALGLLHGALAFTALAAAVVDIIAAHPHDDASILLAAWSLHMIFAVGALVALHHLFTSAASDARRAVALPLAGLAMLWLYDLTLYATSWAQRGWADETAAVRGVVLMLAAPAIANGVHRNARLDIRLSRSAAFQTIGLVAALAYLFAVVVAAAALDATMGRAAQGVQAITLLIAAVLAGLGMTSARVRAWVRVMLAKHLFAHRYDYRGEWLRFTSTLGAPGEDAAPLDVRIVKAVADIVQAPGGLLLMSERGEPCSALQAASRWGWPTLQPVGGRSGEALVPFLERGRIIVLDKLRDDRGLPGEAEAVPEWMIADGDAWAIAPLIHLDRLVGAVLLERPLVDRALDWEDFDLLRLAGRQVASYLAEARAQEALTDAQAFDEFNRRFAFMMHDIKNLASQLALVTRNAERHADKPAFRADMVATLQDACIRLTDLLARLSHHDGVPAKSRDDGPLADLYDVAAGVAAAQRARHPVMVSGQASGARIAEHARLAKALSHLVANAIDASPAAEPVTLTLVRAGGEIGIAVGDHGTGMSPEFVRQLLFRPFASTKADGFGVGAFEARALVTAIGGRIAVESEEGRGSTLTIWLPAPEAVASVAPPVDATRRAA